MESLKKLKLKKYPNPKNNFLNIFEYNKKFKNEPKTPKTKF